MFLTLFYNKLTIKINIKLDNGKYAVFCYDKKDIYHMLPIINDIIYDKTKENLNLYTITIYKKSN